MSCRGPWQAWRGTEHSGQSIHGKDRRARAEGGSAPETWPAACPPPAPSTATGPARPARPAPAPQLESLRLLLSDARGEAVARPAPGTPARSPDRGAAEPATATRLRAPQMSSFTAIVFGEIRESGRVEGAGRWREREGSPGRCSRSRPLCGAGGRGLKRGRPELRASSLCARLPPRRAEPRGPWGGGGAGAGRAACVGRGPGAWRSPSSRSQISGRRRRRRRCWKQPLAAACARSSTVTSWGFWAAGGAARPLELVESTREPPLEPAGRRQALLISPSGAGCFQETLFDGFQRCQPTYPCWVVKALGGSGHGGQAPAPSPAELSLERLGIRATLLHFYVCDQPGIHPSNKNWKANLLSGLGDKVKSVCLSACLPGLLHADNLGTFLPYGDISTAPRLNLLDPLSPSLGRGSGRR